MLTSSCSAITEDLTINCDAPLAAGTRDRGIIFNFDDWNNLTIGRNVTNPQIIENIALTSGITGFLVQGVNGSNAPKNSMKKSKFLNGFMHTVNFKVFRLGADIKKQLEGIANGRFVMVVENNYKGSNGEAAYEVYGIDSGMVCSLLDRDPANQDTQGGYDVTVETSAVTTEGHLPATFFITDYATTKAIFEALV